MSIRGTHETKKAFNKYSWYLLKSRHSNPSGARSIWFTHFSHINRSYH
jgi:hypothetical protein